MNLQRKYEQYKAGEFSAYNLLREARMAYPDMISAYNSIDDAVRILKTKGLVYEKYEAPAVNLSLDTIESGIRFELAEMGCDIFNCNEDQYKKARATAEKCLAKDPLYYVNKKAGIKGKKSDDDQMKPATTQNMVDDANKIQKLQEAILTVALKKMLTEEVNESVVVTLPMTPAGYTRGEVYDTENHGKVKIIDQITNNGDGYEDFKVEKL